MNCRGSGQVVVCTGWSTGRRRRSRGRRQPGNPSSGHTGRSSLTYQFDQPVSAFAFSRGASTCQSVLTTQRRPTPTPDRSGVGKASCKPRATRPSVLGVWGFLRGSPVRVDRGGFLGGFRPVTKTSCVFRFSPRPTEHIGTLFCSRCRACELSLIFQVSARWESCAESQRPLVSPLILLRIAAKS